MSLLGVDKGSKPYRHWFDIFCVPTGGYSNVTNLWKTGKKHNKLLRKIPIALT